MMAYDRVVSELSSARIGGISYPVLHSLLEATRATNAEVR
jgi:nuclear pore complex protein Nup93